VKRWLKLCGVMAIVTAIVVIVNHYHGPGAAERRYERIEIGMAEKDVCSIMGRKWDEWPDWTIRWLDDATCPGRCWLYNWPSPTVNVYVYFDEERRVTQKGIEINGERRWVPEER
jgi:hypothetical protein